MIVFDPVSWLITDVNRSACEVTGRTADELIGRSIKVVLAGPEAGRLGSIVAPVVAGTQDVSRAMIDILRPDGQAKTVEMVIQPIASARAARPSWRSRATSANGSRSRSASSGWPRPSTRAPPS